MSRSKNEVKERIAQRYFEWDSESGQFKYYDHEEKKSVKVPLPFKFIPLDVLGTIKGFNDHLKCGVYSNEVKRVGEQELSVKTFKNGEFAKGLYKDIKGKIVANGGKYANSVYIAYKLGDELVICNIQLTGAAMSSFIDYTKDHKDFMTNGGMQVNGYSNEKKRATKYTKPIFEFMETSKETEKKAIELDIKLQDYLDKYFNASSKGESDAIVDDDNNEPPFDINDVPDEKLKEDDSDLPF